MDTSPSQAVAVIDLMPVIVAMVSGFVAIVGAIVTMMRGHNKSLRESTEHQSKQTVLLEQVILAQAETKADVKTLQVTANQQSTDIAVLKRDLSTAFHRYDDLKELIKA